MSTFDPYHKWLGIPAAEQPPHHYRLLSIALFESDLEVIEAAADRQMSYIRQCATGPHVKESQRILNELSTARVCLLNPAKKETYDRELKSRLAQGATAGESGSSLSGTGGLHTPAYSRSEEGEAAELSLLLLQQSVAAASVPPPPRKLPKKNLELKPYWLWGGGAAAGVVVLASVVYLVLQPGDSATPKKPNDNASISGTQRQIERKTETDRSAVASRKSPAADAEPKKAVANVTEPKITEPKIPETKITVPKAAPLPLGVRTITNSLGMRLVLVSVGTFQMGAEEAAAETFKAFPHAEPTWLTGEHPRHRVRITRPFYLGTCETTQGQFMKFLAATGYKMAPLRQEQFDLGYDSTRQTGDAKGLPWAPGWDRHDDHPVVYVSWMDATAFCQWLSQQERKIYRLPTEAEWEYACRAGTTSRYWFGNDPEALVNFENGPDRQFKDRCPDIMVRQVTEGKNVSRVPFPYLAGNDGFGLTAPVGSFKPNAFGLFDMHGNVSEWCRDWHDSNSYARTTPDNPQGLATGLERVTRGGSWRTLPVAGRSAYRTFSAPAHRSNSLGFRVVCEIDAPTPVTTPPTLPTPPPLASPTSSPLQPGAGPRAVVEGILKLKGEATILTANLQQQRTVRTLADLPQGPFKLTRVALQRGTVADLRAICSLPLEILTLTSREIGDEQLEVLAGAAGINHLHLNNTAGTAVGLEALVRCPQLGNLTVTETNFNLDGWKVLRRIPGLASLSVVNSMASDIQLAELAGHPRLMEMNFTGCRVTGQGFKEFRGKSELQFLSLYDCPIDLAGLQAIGTAFPKLQYLSIHCGAAGRLTDRDLQGLRRFRALERLDLQNTEASDAILDYVPRPDLLKVLDLTNALLTGVGFRKLRGKLSQLEQCTLSSTRLTDEGMKYLAVAAPRLEKLSLTSTAVTDKGLQYLKDSPSLQQLDLRYTKITRKGVQNLIGISTLRTLSFSREAINLEIVDELRKAMPDCNITF